MGCLAGPVGDFMIIFSCPACGSRAFTLSEDLSEAHCAACAKSLGSWQELKQEIHKRLTCSGPAGCDAPLPMQIDEIA